MTYTPKTARLVLLAAAIALSAPGCATLSAAGGVVSAAYTNNQLVFRLAIDRAVNAYIYGGPDPKAAADALVVKAERLRAQFERGAVVDLAHLAAELKNEISLAHLNPIDRATIEEIVVNIELEIGQQISLGELRADAPVLVKGALDRVIATAKKAI